MSIHYNKSVHAQFHCLPDIFTKFVLNGTGFRLKSVSQIPKTPNKFVNAMLLNARRKS